jgi:hypothetical protein
VETRYQAHEPVAHTSTPCPHPEAGLALPSLWVSGLPSLLSVPPVIGVCRVGSPLPSKIPSPQFKDRGGQLLSFLALGVLCICYFR